MTLKIKKIRDYIVELEGKNTLMINEVIKFRNGLSGIVMQASEELASVALLESSVEKPLLVGDFAYPTGEEFKITISNDVLGNIVSVEGAKFTDYSSSVVFAPEMAEVEGDGGKTKTTKVSSAKKTTTSVFKVAEPIYKRDFVRQPLTTGIAAIDWTIPVGKGQRELILGDRKTGKTSIALNAVLAQRNTNMICIYVAIGQKKTSVLDVYEKLKRSSVINRTVIVSASADQIATKKWLAPYVGVTIAEHFREKYGSDVLVIYDDLSKHADAYRELSLLLNTAPAREAYPGDIFYLHSKLLERAGRFHENYGGGSITALPIVQTEAGDITSYIPTNVISITDGQIFTSKSLFNEGQRPAIDIPYSVSRVGSDVQSKLLAKASKGLKLLVSQFEEAKKMMRLSGQATDDLAETVRRGRSFTSLIIQKEDDVLEAPVGVLLLNLFRRGYLNFFKTPTQVDFVRDVISNFFANDYLGVRISQILDSQEDVDPLMFELLLKEVLLPFLKHQLLTAYPELKYDDSFIKTYEDVRSDGRVFSVFGGGKSIREVA